VSQEQVKWASAYPPQDEDPIPRNQLFVAKRQALTNPRTTTSPAHPSQYPSPHTTAGSGDITTLPNWSLDLLAKRAQVEVRRLSEVVQPDKLAAITALIETVATMSKQGESDPKLRG